MPHQQLEESDVESSVERQVQHGLAILSGNIEIRAEPEELLSGLTRRLASSGFPSVPRSSTATAGERRRSWPG